MALLPKSLRSQAHEVLIRELKGARLKADMSQQQVADRLDVPQSFVSKVESGERRIDVVEFLKFVEAVGGSWRDILKRVDAADF